MKTDYITIHHNAPIRNEFVCYSKGKKYTYKEYVELLSRKQLIKEILFVTAFGAFMAIRAYAFYKYGI